MGVNRMSSSAKLSIGDEIISFWEVIFKGFKPITSETDSYVVYDLICSDYQILVAGTSTNTPIISPILKQNRTGSSPLIFNN